MSLTFYLRTNLIGFQTIAIFFNLIKIKFRMAIILNIDELKALCDEIEYEKRSERPGQDFFLRFIGISTNLISNLNLA